MNVVKIFACSYLIITTSMAGAMNGQADQPGWFKQQYRRGMAKAAQCKAWAQVTAAHYQAKAVAATPDCVKKSLWNAKEKARAAYWQFQAGVVSGIIPNNRRSYNEVFVCGDEGVHVKTSTVLVSEEGMRFYLTPSVAPFFSELLGGEEACEVNVSLDADSIYLALLVAHRYASLKDVENGGLGGEKLDAQVSVIAQAPELAVLLKLREDIAAMGIYWLARVVDELRPAAALRQELVALVAARLLHTWKPVEVIREWSFLISTVKPFAKKAGVALWEPELRDALHDGIAQMNARLLELGEVPPRDFGVKKVPAASEVDN